MYMRKRLMSLHDHGGDTVSIIQCRKPTTRVPGAAENGLGHVKWLK